MKTILNILTHPEDDLTCAFMRQQAELPEFLVITLDLTQPAPDYPRVVEEVFKADNVQVW